ncbi:PilW family protein [Rhodanobacter sp. DHG33]|uniref:PilW family protein n=1 Tax=Rhodanobacter sp. DHG33 TaxID=2775921 RepID=UPI0017855D70|nr:PilW family protein [Rhodanobacter sp. DHG33]MBD8898107.1 PilW family protein [Rhodanobacter sp. DHG33]
MRQSLHRFTQSGLSLIELMIAMVLGLLVAAGIISVFISTSSSNRVQTQLAALQETGRFAINRMSSDLLMANGQYCTNSGGIATPIATSGGTYLDGLRAPTVYAKNLTAGMYDVTTPMGGNSGGNTYPSAPSSSSYTFPSFLSMRGYDCTTSSCTPVNPSSSLTAIPAMAPTLNDRVPGTAVLTVRYINPSRGWAIGRPGYTYITPATAGSTSSVSSITIAPDSSVGEPPASDFRSGDLAMLADCSNAQIFTADDTGGVISVNTSKNNGTPVLQQPSSAPKLFDFTRDYQTVTYYVKLVSLNNNGAAPYTGALMRRVNGGASNPGGSEDEIAQGVERLDFKYGVEDGNGMTSFLTAKQVDSGAVACPPSAPNPLGSDPGCLWRAVKSIEINILVDGQQPLYTLTSNDMSYVYTVDPSSTKPAAPTDASHAIHPTDQGFVNQLLRRQFTTLISLRNFNP